MNIVTSFAAEIARAAAAERSNVGGATEERDLRRALAFALPQHAAQPLSMAAASERKGSRASQPKHIGANTMHEGLLEARAG